MFNKCKIFGHKWVPAFVKGYYGFIEVKFIGCYCSRCRLGYWELSEAIGKQTKRVYNTYNESYFKGD